MCTSCVTIPERNIDNPAIISHQTAEIGARSRYRSRAVGADNITLITPRQAADITVSTGRACAVAIIHRCAVIHTYQAADIPISIDRHRTIAIINLHRPAFTIMIPYQTANRIITTGRSRAVGIGDITLIHPHQAADIITCSGYHSCAIRLGNIAIINSRQAANIITTGYSPLTVGTIDIAEFIVPDQSADMINSAD